MTKKSAITTELRDAYRAKLAESAIDARVEKAVGLRLLDPTAVAKLLPGLEKKVAGRGGFVLPYFARDWKRRTDLVRVRLLGEPVGWARYAGASLPKYLQPLDSPVGAYFPPVGDWTKLLEDRTRRLVITEGELKAITASWVGIPTIGLGGVWSYGRKAIDGLLPELAGVDWEDRRVEIVYDTDIRSKPGVRGAFLALAEKLTAMGAQVIEVGLVDVPGRAKTGLDDFLVYHRKSAAEAFERLPREAFDKALKLWEMNERVAYIETPGLIVELATGETMAVRAFKEHRYAPFKHVKEVLRYREWIPTEVATAPEWVSWANRRSHRRLVYAPGRPPITRRNEYNLWAGWGEDGQLEPARGDVRLWRSYFDYLFAGLDADERGWVEKWLAWPIQRPERAKTQAALFVWSPIQGAGKSFLGKVMKRLYGAAYAEIGPEKLDSAFTSWARNKMFVMIDEARGSDRRADSNLIKRMVSQDTVEINIKYLPEYELDDTMNFYVTSNYSDAIELDPGDRRFFVHQFTGAKRPPEFFDQVEAWLDHEGGTAALLYHLLTIDLDGFQPYAAPPTTTAKLISTVNTKSALEMWSFEIREDAEAWLSSSEMAGDLYDAATLLLHLPEEVRGRASVAGVGRALTNAGFEQRSVRTNFGVKRLYAVRNPDRWAKSSSSEWRKHYEAKISVIGTGKKKKEKF